MKIALTGATGFIGRHVLQALASQDIEIIALSRQAKPDFPASLNIRTIQCDIAGAEPPDFADIDSPDILVHLAWDGLPNYHSLHHFETELPNQYRFLSHLIKTGLRHVTITGTCFEYGMASGPLSEEMRPQPENSYAFAKDALRQQLQYLQKDHPFCLTWARLFYMYGAGQGPKSLYSLLKAAVEAGEPVFNMSAGEQLRDFLSVDDIGRHVATLACLKKDVGIVNVCSGTPTSVRTLVEGWIDANNWQIALNRGYFPYPAYEPLAFWGSDRKLKKLLRRQPHSQSR